MKKILKIVLAIAILALAIFFIPKLNLLSGGSESSNSKGKPTAENIEYYFQSENNIDIGTATGKVNSGEVNQYTAVMINRLGVNSLVLLPKDFNKKELNLKSFIHIDLGEDLSRGNVDLAGLNLRDRLEEMTKNSVSVVSKHNVTTWEDGDPHKVVYPYYMYEDGVKENTFYFFLDEMNYFEVTTSDDINKEAGMLPTILRNF